jgi:hypothetical protein
MLKISVVVALFVAWFLAATVPNAAGFALLGPLQNLANGAADPWQGKPYGERPSGNGGT